MTVNDIFAIIGEKLNEKGYRLRRSHRFRELMKFEEHWGHIFNLLYENPFLRLIFQYFLAEPKILDIPTILTEFRENREIIEEVLSELPLYVDVCPICNSDSFIKKSVYRKEIYYCKSCKQQFESPIKKQSLSELGPFDMYRFLMELVNAGILTYGYQLICYRCGKMESSYKYEDVRNVLCPQCGDVRELTHIFSLVNPPKDIRNLDSVWLEWYVYKLVKDKCQNFIMAVLPTCEVTSGDFRTEVDLLVLMKNGRLLSLDCKAKHFRKTLSKDDIDPNVLNWNKFSDAVGFVTTSKISKQCIQFWKDKLKNPVFVDGSNLEKLDEILQTLAEQRLG
jgi:transcription elongation factor Elf1